MLFHSFQFAGFFAVTYTLYLALRHKAQNRLLLLASYIFYASWDWRFLSLIMITTATDFLCARAIHNRADKTARKRFVAISCIINLGILCAFKYFGFFIDSFVSLFATLGYDISGPTLNIILPVGISFYTFQSLSYTIDVYRKQVEPAQNILDYALFVSLFPQLIAGPIERGKTLLPQILSARAIDADMLRTGLFLICLGLFKKLFVADNLGPIVDPIFAPGADISGAMVLIGGYAFLFQIYCDFSAYTDIARGTSRMMGFELMENFRAPFLARNIQDFWNRWHISLTTWVRDYLYYPLAFHRFGKTSLPPPLILIITFSILGLWHGAAWGFVFWGFYNGVLLALFGEYAKRRRKVSDRLGPILKPLSGLGPVFGVFVTFNVIFIGTLFFRATSIDQAFGMVLAFFTDFHPDAVFLTALSQMAWFVAPIILIDFWTREKPIEERILDIPRPARYASIVAMFLAVAIYGGAIPTFIYFQF